MLTATNPPMAGIQDTQVHLARRRSWARGLSPSALKEYEGLVGRRVRQLLRLLEAQDATVVLGQVFNYFRCVMVFCTYWICGGSWCLRSTAATT